MNRNKVLKLFLYLYILLLAWILHEACGFVQYPFATQRLAGCKPLLQTAQAGLTPQPGGDAGRCGPSGGNCMSPHAISGLATFVSADTKFEEFSFIVASDPHLNITNGIEKFEKLVTEVNKIADKYDFVFITGDIGLPSEEIDIPSKFKIPVHIVFGNSEYENGRKKLKKMFPEGGGPYSFAHKNCLFIGLCNAQPGDHVGHLEAQRIPMGQIKFINNELEKNYKLRQYIFIFMHIPFTVTDDEEELRSKDYGKYYCMMNKHDRDYLLGLVKKYSPDAVFFGHHHVYKETKVDNKTRIIYVPTSGYLDVKSGFLTVEVSSSKFDVIYRELSQ